MATNDCPLPLGAKPNGHELGGTLPQFGGALRIDESAMRDEGVRESCLPILRQGKKPWFFSFHVGHRLSGARFFLRPRSFLPLLREMSCRHRHAKLSIVLLVLFTSEPPLRPHRLCILLDTRLPGHARSTWVVVARGSPWVVARLWAARDETIDAGAPRIGTPSLKASGVVTPRWHRVQQGRHGSPRWRLGRQHQRGLRRGHGDRLGVLLALLQQYGAIKKGITERVHKCIDDQIRHELWGEEAPPSRWHERRCWLHTHAFAPSGRRKLSLLDPLCRKGCSHLGMEVLGLLPSRQVRSAPWRTASKACNDSCECSVGPIGGCSRELHASTLASACARKRCRWGARATSPIARLF
mmetsp:Transcript_101953/g.287769  ORF Transcript_101953/g.287769 Transcript_101953/m.287769 type:complete len:354 (+) Transcript_101953:31-1092(+)